MGREAYLEGIESFGLLHCGGEEAHGLELVRPLTGLLWWSIGGFWSFSDSFLDGDCLVRFAVRCQEVRCSDKRESHLHGEEDADVNQIQWKRAEKEEEV